MNGPTEEKVQVKVTIAADENPELFQAVNRVRGLRRRSARLRDLAIKGLNAEVAGATGFGKAPVSAGMPSIAEAGSWRAPPDTVDEMLNWNG